MVAERPVAARLLLVESVRTRDGVAAARADEPWRRAADEVGLVVLRRLGATVVGAAVVDGAAVCLGVVVASFFTVPLLTGTLAFVF